MALTLYKETNATGNSTGGFLNFIRWLTGESRGSLSGGATTGPAGITVVEVFDGSSDTGAPIREVSTDGTLDGLTAGNRWRTGAAEITSGWIIIDVPGTGLNGNAGFQFCYQFTSVLGAANDGFALIPNGDWTTGVAVVAEWTDKASFLTAGAITVATTPANVTGSWTATDTWYAWCDEGVVCFARDESPVASVQIWYVGEVDSGDALDTKPFVISSLTAMTPDILEVNNAFRRVSPIDGTTELSGAENWGFDHFDANNAWAAGQTQFLDYGPGWPRSEQWIAFDDVNHAHFAGKLRYVQRTMADAAQRGTSDTLTRWLCSVGISTVCISLPWDGATAYP